LRIEDYALIGDLHTAALVGRDGSMDWLCMPRFDSGACFSALLGEEDNGRWLVGPKEKPSKIVRRYRGDTLILETEFRLRSGIVGLIDFMPIRSNSADLVRIVEGVSGEVDMIMDLLIRFDYGSITPWFHKQDGASVAIAGPDRLTLRTKVDVIREDNRLRAAFRVRKGQKIAFNLTWSPSNEEPRAPINPMRALQATERWWKKWVKGCTIPGKWREKVTRSLITLKALTYRPTGGIVAAATTSLPERIGGVRNWDYRYCWLRDASFTLFALMSCGYVEEAREWLQWLLRATAGHPAESQVLYGVAGERRLSEFEVGWLTGYENSRPVRIGNAANQQFQLDVFGEILDAIHKWWLIKRRIADFGWALIRSMMQFLEQAWRRPDEGIWEVRGPRRHFTHSKLMAWVAFDRAVDLAERSEWNGPVEQWRAVREEIQQEILDKAFDRKLNSFVQFYGSHLVDAAALRIPLVGFLPANDERVRGTLAAIEKNLVVDGFVHRYRSSRKIDGLPEGEGTFLMCTLWYADVLHMSGRKVEARKVFERVLSIGNDVGLLAEMYDPKMKRQVGNFPQAFSHVGIVNTALRLSGTGLLPEDIAPSHSPGL
jgi:GH15 family glucan-1,4-alpha-glucosidase